MSNSTTAAAAIGVGALGTILAYYGYKKYKSAPVVNNVEVGAEAVQPQEGEESKEILQAASEEVNDWLKKASSGWGQFWKKEYEEMTQQSEGSMTPPESTETDI